MDIIIIGGGASGILLALLLSNNKKNNITLIEKNNKLGKKLLITGNGKCNFTNDTFDREDINNDNFYYKYYNNLYTKKILTKYNKKQLIDLFADIGIEYTTINKYDINYYYPRSLSSSSILYNIYDKLCDNNVNIIYDEEFLDYNYNNKFEIITSKSKYYSDILCLATGGLSYPNTGSDGKVLNILKNHNFNIIPTLPALCPILCENDILLKNSKNIRVNAKVSSYINNKLIDTEIGEIQILDNAISGIPAFQLSSKIHRALLNNNKVKISINFLYNFSTFQDALIFIKNRKNKLYYKNINYFLCSYINDKITESIMFKLGINKNKVSELNDNDLINITKLLLNYELYINKINYNTQSQITSGGVDTDELTDSLETKKQKKLYLLGEMLDIDGKCGGFNLQYAFSSAFLVSNKINNDKN